MSRRISPMVKKEQEDDDRGVDADGLLRLFWTILDHFGRFEEDDDE